MCGVVYTPAAATPNQPSGFYLSNPILDFISAAGNNLCRRDFLIIEESRNLGSADLPVRRQQLTVALILLDFKHVFSFLCSAPSGIVLFPGRRHSLWSRRRSSRTIGWTATAAPPSAASRGTSRRGGASNPSVSGSHSGRTKTRPTMRSWTTVTDWTTPSCPVRGGRGKKSCCPLGMKKTV